MLKIQVNGHGMIPRGLGIAPRKEPFPADRNLIYTILQTPGLSINYLHPGNGKLLPLTKQNMKTVLDKYQHSSYEKVKVAAPMKPHTPEGPKHNPNPVTPPAAPVEPPKPVVTPPQTPDKKDEKTPAPEIKDDVKKPEVKEEEKKPEDKKPEEKKDEKSGAMMPIAGKGQNAQDTKNNKK